MRTRGVTAVSIVVVVVLATLSGCGGGDDPADPSSGGGGRRSAPPVFQAGDSITVVNGSEFVVELDANPTTGYAWTAEPNAHATYVSSTQATDSTLVGAPGMQRLTFRATETGSSTLVLNYARSFEPDEPPAQTESFPLTVE